jgi:quercetin dioxygenase-like cupin family protein
MPDEVKVMDEFDEAIDTIIRDPGASAGAVSPEIAAALRVAADLRQLPPGDFKSRLRAQLQSVAPLPRLIESTNMGETIPLALAELDSAPALLAHDSRAALHDMPELAMRFLARMDAHTIGVSRFSRGHDWERHPAADELLYMMEGDADITTLTARGPVQSAFPAGSLFICPRGLWHRIHPHRTVSLLFVTPGEGTESHANPQFVPAAEGSEPAAADRLEAVSLRGILPQVPLLDIQATTTVAQAEASFRRITDLDQYPFFVSRFRGLSPWEQHNGGDELLHILEGDVELTVLTDEGAVERALGQGSIFVCPRGLWHRQRAPRSVTLLSATPQPSRISWADDPRT